MILGTGIDISEVERIKNSIENYGDRFKNKIFTTVEQEYCERFGEQKRYMHYAARFAAKEAFSKAIGTGISKGFVFKEIYIENELSGKPNIILSGSMNDLYGQYRFHVTLSHTDSIAVAAVVMEQV